MQNYRFYVNLQKKSLLSERFFFPLHNKKSLLVRNWLYYDHCNCNFNVIWVCSYLL